MSKKIKDEKSAKTCEIGGNKRFTSCLNLFDRIKL